MVTWVTCIRLKHKQRLILVLDSIASVVVKFVIIIAFTYIGLLLSIRAVAKSQRRP